MKIPSLALILSFTAMGAFAQSTDLPYGAPVPLETARKVLAAAQAEAQKNRWNVAIAVVDSGGHLVAFERMDTTRFGSVHVALEKARTAVGFRRPSKAFQDVVAGGGEGLRILALTGAMPIEGGVPVIVDGRIVGAVGVSGVTSAQDGQIARAGAAAVAGKQSSVTAPARAVASAAN